VYFPERGWNRPTFRIARGLLECEFETHSPERKRLPDDKLYKAEYLGSGTFAISKPKRKKTKIRQTQLKNPQRGARK
jgi:hypothetical protein